jgi:hypothetical protein
MKNSIKLKPLPPKFYLPLWTEKFWWDDINKTWDFMWILRIHCYWESFRQRYTTMSMTQIHSPPEHSSNRLDNCQTLRVNTKTFFTKIEHIQYAWSGVAENGGACELLFMKLLLHLAEEWNNKPHNIIQSNIMRWIAIV